MLFIKFYVSELYLSWKVIKLGNLYWCYVVIQLKILIKNLFCWKMLVQFTINYTDLVSL